MRVAGIFLIVLGALVFSAPGYISGPTLNPLSAIVYKFLSFIEFAYMIQQGTQWESYHTRSFFCFIWGAVLVIVGHYFLTHYPKEKTSTQLESGYKEKTSKQSIHFNITVGAVLFMFFSPFLFALFIDVGPFIFLLTIPIGVVIIVINIIWSLFSKK